MKNKSTFSFAAGLCCMLLSFATFDFSLAQVRLVEDIDVTSKTTGDSKTFYFHESDGTRSFFVANGDEFWTSDGTTAGTKIIRRFLVVNEIEVIGGICFLNALTEDHGAELWKSDGTAAGTVLLKDVYPGRGSSSPLRMINVDGTLFFSANDPVHGRELWKSDGTAEGTQLVKDIVPGSQASTPRLLVKNGSKVFFTATTVNEGEEIWSTDGTPAGTVLVKDVFPGPASSAPKDLTASDGWVFFSANIDPASRQLLKSNGTAEGTTLVKDINPGSDAKIGRMTDVEGLVFFQAYEPEHGLELWRSDGTDAGTFLLKDFTPGPGSDAGYASNHLDHFANINGKLVFTAESDVPRVWISDGTPAGTKQAIYPGGQPYLWGLPSVAFHEINGSAYFRATNELSSNLYRLDMNGNMFQVRRNLGGDLFEQAFFARIGATHYFIIGDYFWKTDGSSSGTTPIRTLGVPSGSNPSDFIDFNGTLYFSRAWPNEIWKSNGTAGTTDKVMDVDFVDELSLHNNILLITGSRNGDPVNSLYKSDGTAEGTYLLAPQPRYPANFTKANDQTFFSAMSSNEGTELWRTDGTPEGTSLVADIQPGTAGSSPRNLTAVGGHLFFTASAPSRGYELFRTNGLNETYMVKDILPGVGSSQPGNLVSFKGKLFFQANDGVNGFELWQSNGSNTFTTMVKDIRTNDNGSADMGGMIATTDYLYFAALNEEGKISLWRSDGTTEGTVQLMTLDSSEQYPEMLATTGANAFFLARFDTHMELWRTNGTSTVRLANFRNQAFFSTPYEKVAVKNNTVYFITDYWPQSSFLWRTDGTFGGTYAISFDGRPQQVYTSGPHVYLAGISQKEGHELFVIEEGTSATAERLVAIHGEPDVAIRNFPNPFENTFMLMVPGAVGEKFLLNVIDMQGQIVSFEDNVPCNTELQIGATWKAGMYVLQVRQNDRMVVRKVVKGKR